MNSKQRKTLFNRPVSGTVAWAEIEDLLLAAGATLIEGQGPRVRFTKDQVVPSFHRPHPENETKRCQDGDALAFLEQIGDKP